ncbi:hypothetical protein GCM10027299_28260 [Larkinella ripae]
MALIDNVYRKLQDQFKQGVEFGPAGRVIQSLDQNNTGEIMVTFSGLLILLEEVGDRIIVKIPGGVRSSNNDHPADWGALCDAFIAQVKAEAGDTPLDEILV